MHQQEKKGVYCPDAIGNHEQGVLFGTYVLDEEQQKLAAAAALGRAGGSFSLQ